MQILIRGGNVIDPGNFEGIADILVNNGIIADIFHDGSGLSPPEVSKNQHSGTRIIDASGKIVTPGLIDMHVHLREPGQEHKETIETGCRAAVHGGYTAVCCMPNTSPVNDSRKVTEFIIAKARKAGLARVYPVAAISQGLAGEHLCDFARLREAGAVAVSDDGHPVMDSGLMRRAMEAAKAAGMPVISHCEDFGLVRSGGMNEGAVADILGLPGIPNASESIMVMRDIALSELTGTHVHIAHVSTAESVRAIREAKSRGVSVTAETAPHYFILTDEVVKDCLTNAKMNPPLRSAKDRSAIRAALSDGTIDVIATDHAPHSPDEKASDFIGAPNGIIGLETALALGWSLVTDGVLSLVDLIDKMATRPAALLGLVSGLKPGMPADISVIDPNFSYRVDSDQFQSKSRNTPFEGWDVTGKPVLTMVGGRIVFEAD